MNKSFIITGTPGSGKTTVSQRLMVQFPFGIHIPVDDLREMVVSGIAHPGSDQVDETGRQFRLARQAAAHIAQTYINANFAVAIDDVISPGSAEVFFEQALEPESIHKILLRPSLEVTLQRNRSRTNKSFDTSILEELICTIYARQNVDEYIERGWMILDNGEEDVMATVQRIMAQVAQ